MKPRQNFTTINLNAAISQTGDRDVEVRSKRAGALATGEINVLALGHVRVLAGKLYGQHPFEATVKAEPGLAIEVRMKGQSRSFDVDEPSRNIEVSAVSCFLTASPEPSTWHVSAPSQSEFETVTFEFAAEFFDDLQRLDPSYASRLKSLSSRKVALPLTPNTLLLNLAARAVTIAGEKPDGSELRAYALVIEVLAQLRTELMGGSDANLRSPSSDLTAKIVEFIDAQAHAQLSLSEVAAHFHVSPSLIKSRLSQFSRGSFSELLQASLMVRALQMVNDQLPIRTIAELLGYSSPEALTKRFTKHHGCPPTDFRKMSRWTEK